MIAISNGSWDGSNGLFSNIRKYSSIYWCVFCHRNDDIWVLFTQSDFSLPVNIKISLSGQSTKVWLNDVLKANYGTSST